MQEEEQEKIGKRPLACRAGAKSIANNNIFALHTVFTFSFYRLQAKTLLEK